MGLGWVRTTVFGLALLTTVGGVTLAIGGSTLGKATNLDPAPPVSIPIEPVATPWPTTAGPFPVPVVALEPDYEELEAASGEEELGRYPEGAAAFGCHPPDGSYSGEAGDWEEGDYLPSTVAPPAAGSPGGAGAVGSVAGQTPPARTTSFTVKPGDTLSDLAGVFGISPETIRWANGLEGSEDSLEVGQVLTILPVTGVLHEVVSGDTVAAIASAYAVEPGSIVEANGLGNPDAIPIGKKLIVPGGKPRSGIR